MHAPGEEFVTFKRLMPIIAVFAFGFAVTACGEDKTADTATPAAPAQEPAQEPTPAAPEVARADLPEVSWTDPTASAELPQGVDEILSERALGDPDAPVTIIEFSSLTCPHCAALHEEVLPIVKAELIDTGKARLVFRDFPLDPVALAASTMARCAPPRSYFKILNILFDNQDQWARSDNPVDSLTGLMALAGLPRERALECIDTPEIYQGIAGWREQASNEYGVNSTPTMVVEGEVLRGVHSYDAIKAAVEKRLP